MPASPTINIIMATDAQGLEPNATVLHSLQQHQTLPIHARIFVRDLPEQTFEVENMKVEFIITPDELRMKGRSPAHVSSLPALDRMSAIHYCEDWERALVLDYDQLVVGDVSPLFSLDFKENLAAGRLWHLNLGDTSMDWFGRRIPRMFQHCYQYRFLMFGPLMNLAGMREADTFAKLTHYQRIADTEEQISFHIACEDRVIGIDSRFNLVPQWDGYRDDAIIYHFTGGDKPWLHPGTENTTLWEKYSLTWEELRSRAY